MEDRIEVKKLRAQFPDEILLVRDQFGDLCIDVKRDKLVEICTLLQSDPELDFKLFLDICGVDFLDFEDEASWPHEGMRFASVYHVRSLTRRTVIRLRVPLREDDAVVPSVYSVWNGADWFEREAWDMTGIVYKNHPLGMYRLLTHEEFEGHPLRKDYPMGRRHLLSSPSELNY